MVIERPGRARIADDRHGPSGDKTYCWIDKDGHAERAEIRTGVSDGEWIEVTNLQLPDAAKSDHPWKPVTARSR